MTTHLFVEQIHAAQYPQDIGSGSRRAIRDLRVDGGESSGRGLAGGNCGLRVVPDGFDAHAQRSAGYGGLRAESTRRNLRQWLACIVARSHVIPKNTDSQIARGEACQSIVAPVELGAGKSCADSSEPDDR